MEIILIMKTTHQRETALLDAASVRGDRSSQHSRKKGPRCALHWLLQSWHDFCYLLCSLMFYLEVTAVEVHGKDERGQQIIRQLVACRPRGVLETDGVSLE